MDANNGLVEVPRRNGRCITGKKRRVVEEEMREEFDRDWGPVYGDSMVTEVWQERYGQSMDAGEETGQDAMDWEMGKIKEGTIFKV